MDERLKPREREVARICINKDESRAFNSLADLSSDYIRDRYLSNFKTSVEK